MEGVSIMDGPGIPSLALAKIKLRQVLALAKHTTRKVPVAPNSPI